MSLMSCLSLAAYQHSLLSSGQLPKILHSHNRTLLDLSELTFIIRDHYHIVDAFYLHAHTNNVNFQHLTINSVSIDYAIGWIGDRKDLQSLERDIRAGRSVYEKQNPFDVLHGSEISVKAQEPHCLDHIIRRCCVQI